MRLLKQADPACPCGDIRHRMCRWTRVGILPEDPPVIEIISGQRDIGDKHRKTHKRWKRFNWTRRSQSVSRSKRKTGNCTNKVDCKICDIKSVRSQQRRADKRHYDGKDWALVVQPKVAKRHGNAYLNRVLQCKYQRAKELNKDDVAKESPAQKPIRHNDDQVKLELY